MLRELDICYSIHCVDFPVEVLHGFDRLQFWDLTSSMNPQPSFGGKNTNIIKQIK